VRWLAPSYAQFIELANGTPVDWSKVPVPVAQTSTVVGCGAHVACGDGVDLVTIDMPVRADPDRKRREADSAVSQKFGSRVAATHSPAKSGPATWVVS